MSKIGKIIKRWTEGVKSPKSSEFILNRLQDSLGKFSENSTEIPVKRTSKK